VPSVLKHGPRSPLRVRAGWRNMLSCQNLRSEIEKDVGESFRFRAGECGEESRIRPQRTATGSQSDTC